MKKCAILLLLGLPQFSQGEYKSYAPCYGCSSSVGRVILPSLHGLHGYLVDCQWSEWSWSACSVTCGSGGTQTGSRYILTSPTGGGRPCGHVTRCRRDCDGPPCPVQCQWGQWSPWACQGNCYKISLDSNFTMLQDVSKKISSCFNRFQH